MLCLPFGAIDPTPLYNYESCSVKSVLLVCNQLCFASFVIKSLFVKCKNLEFASVMSRGLKGLSSSCGQCNIREKHCSTLFVEHVCVRHTEDTAAELTS